MLRDYQAKAVKELRECYAGGMRAPLFVLPTGGGKTFVFCHIAENVTRRNKSACILVHRQELLMQSSRSLRNIGVQHGLIAPGWNYRNENIAVASVQTLIGRIKKEPERYKFDLLIIDEAHHAVAGTWLKIIANFPKAKILGVTATACRADGKGLGISSGGVFDSMVIGPSVSELIALGHLVRPIVYAPPTKVDLSQVHMRGGDYNAKELTGAVDKPKITGDAVAHYARLCPFKPAVAFCASIEHAEHVAAEFCAAGFKAVALDGSVSDGERKATLEGLASGEIHVVTSCDLISEGTDIPAIEAAILLRPTKSEGLYIQQVGRALRPSPGKHHALILDHVGNCLVHGMPDEDRAWTLNGVDENARKKSAAARADFQCMRCYAFFKPANACPYCGKERDTKERTIEQVEGELKPLTAEEIAALRRHKHKENKAAETIEELIELGRKRGYKNPLFWAKHYMNARKKEGV